MTGRHPGAGEYWEWDDGNERELWRHGIRAGEADQVFDNGPTWIPNLRHGAGDWKMVGLTDGGRRLTIVVRFYPDRMTLRAITGWETTRAERTKYRKGDRQ